MVRNLLTCIFFTFLPEIAKKKQKKYCVGVIAVDLSTEGNEKSKVKNPHFEKKCQPKKFCSRKTKDISFRAMPGCILPKQKILKSKLPAGEQIY